MAEKTIIRYNFRYRCLIKGRIVKSRFKATRDQIMQMHPDAEILEETAEMIRIDDSFLNGFTAIMPELPDHK